MTLDEYQKRALSTAIDDDVELIHRALGLAAEAGEVAGKLNKWTRDHKFDESKIDKKAIAKELGDVLWFLATLSDYLGFSLEKIGQENLGKLQDRKQRGVISGSGDNR